MSDLNVMESSDSSIDGGSESVSTPNNGETAATLPKTGGKYDRWYDLNPEAKEVGASDDNGSKEDEQSDDRKPVPPKAPEKPQENKGKKPTIDELAKKKGWSEERKQKELDWERRERVMTARNKTQAEAHAREMEATRKELAELRAKIEGKHEKPKLKRENFVSDEEYLETLAERKAEEKLAAQMQGYQKQSYENQVRQEAQQEFKRGWTSKVHNNFRDESERREFVAMVEETPDNLHQEIHEFVQNSDVGPRMLHVMLQRPEYIDALNQLPASVRATRLGQLESAIYSQMQSSRAPAQPRQQAPSRPAAALQRATRAPAPIGSVGNSGSSAAPEDLPDQDQVAAYKRKKFGV